MISLPCCVRTAAPKAVVLPPRTSDVAMVAAGGAHTGGAGVVLGTIGWLLCAAGSVLDASASVVNAKPGAVEDSLGQNDLVTHWLRFTPRLQFRENLTIVGQMDIVTGLVVGWRPQHGLLSVLAAFGIGLLFAYALAWACACLGMVSKGPESAMSIGLGQCSEEL